MNAYQIIVQKLRNIFGGSGRGHQKITLNDKGRGVWRSRGSKKGLGNFSMVPNSRRQAVAVIANMMNWNHVPRLNDLSKMLSGLRLYLC